MKNAIRLISILLMFSMVFVTFSCNSKDSNTNNDDVVSDNLDNNSTSEDDTSEPQNTEIPFPHEVRNFGGIDFTILIDRQWSQNLLDITDFDVEGETGDVLDDAYYKRNLLIEETYNVKLKGLRVDDITDFARKTVQAGLDEYDAFAPRLMNAGSFASKGYGVNLFDTILNLDSPWWDQNITRDTSIGGAAYIITGDLFIKHYDGISMLMFNKRLIAELGLETPYQLVNDNQWTIDKFNEMAKTATRDLDANGVMNRYDQYGFVTQADSVTSWINAMGEKIVSKDSDDMPYFTGYSEKMVSIFDKMLDVYVDDTYCMHRDAYGKESGSGQSVQFWVFPEGRSLFYWGFPRYMELGLREMEDDFGILPLPKWDSNQSRYYSTLNNWHSYTYMIPITASDVEMNAYVLEAMAYHGRNIIKPAYYDVCLQRKYTRDDESSAMLDIIFSSTVYDLGTVFSIGGYVGALESDLQKNQNNMTSNFEKFESRIEKDIENLIKQFENQ